MTVIASSAAGLAPEDVDQGLAESGRSNIRVRVGLRMSASIRRVRSPALTHRSASCAASVVFPSPLQAEVIRTLRLGPARGVPASPRRSRPGDGRCSWMNWSRSRLDRASSRPRRAARRGGPPTWAAAGRPRGRSAGARAGRSSGSCHPAGVQFDQGHEQADHGQEHPDRRRGHHLEAGGWTVGDVRGPWPCTPGGTGRPGPWRRTRLWSRLRVTVSRTASDRDRSWRANSSVSSSEPAALVWIVQAFEPLARAGRAGSFRPAALASRPPWSVGRLRPSEGPGQAWAPAWAQSDVESARCELVRPASSGEVDGRVGLALLGDPGWRRSAPGGPSRGRAWSRISATWGVGVEGGDRLLVAGPEAGSSRGRAAGSDRNCSTRGLGLDEVEVGLQVLVGQEAVLRRPSTEFRSLAWRGVDHAPIRSPPGRRSPRASGGRRWSAPP